MFQFSRNTLPATTGYYNNTLCMNRLTPMSMGNYDSDDDEEYYDPDEDLEMMFDEDDYAEMHEN